MTRRGNGTFRALGEELDARLGEIMGELGRAIEEATGRADGLRPGEFSHERRIGTPSGSLQAGVRVRVGGLAAGAAGAGEAGGEDAAAFRPVARRRSADDATAGRDMGEEATGGSASRAAVPPRAEAAPDTTPQPVDATILEVDGTWTLVADLPGVGPGDVRLAAGDGEGDLVIEAHGRRRRYAGRFALPVGLCVEALTMSLVNGVLELRGEVPSP